MADVGYHARISQWTDHDASHAFSVLEIVQNARAINLPAFASYGTFVSATNQSRSLLEGVSRGFSWTL